MSVQRSSLGGYTRNQNLISHTLETLGTAIVSGVYGIDNPLPFERDLHKQFGTSRGTLREAIKMLTAKGLLGARPRLGTWVEPEENWNWLDPDVLRWLRSRNISNALLRELVEFRLAVEPAVAALAARSATPEHIASIKRALARLHAAEFGNDDRLDAEAAFHAAIVRAGANRFHAQLGSVTKLALRLCIRQANCLRSDKRSDIVDYERIVSAIVARDATEAQSALYAIIRQSLDLIDRGAPQG